MYQILAIVVYICTTTTIVCVSWVLACVYVFVGCANLNRMLRGCFQGRDLSPENIVRHREYVHWVRFGRDWNFWIANANSCPELFTGIIATILRQRKETGHAITQRTVFTLNLEKCKVLFISSWTFSWSNGYLMHCSKKNTDISEN